MASGLFQSAKKTFIDRSVGGGFDVDTDTLNILLVASDIAANLNTWDFRNDLTEVTGTNYTAGGLLLSGVSVTASGGTVTIDATDVTFVNVTIANIRGSVIYKVVGTAATDPLLIWHDLGAQVVSAADFIIQWNASGIFTLA